MSPRFLPLIALLVAPSLGADATAQTVGGEWSTTISVHSDASGFGRSACRIEDIDADGVADFAIGLPYFSPFWGTEAGGVRFYSGASGLLLRSTYGANAYDHLGECVAAISDLNGDGIGEYILGAPCSEVSGMSRAGSVFVRSGADDSLLFQLDGNYPDALFGQAVASIPDVNGDQLDEILIGAPGSSPSGKTGAGEAFVYSGANGTMLASFQGEHGGDSFGHSVAHAGDVNHDGMPEILVGALTTDVGFRANCGTAYLFSGSSHQQIWRVDGAHSNDFLGRSVSGAGDINGDGCADIILGAPGSDPDNKSFAGSAFVHSGADGSLLHRFDGLDPSDALGASVANAGDVNGDGTTDFILGAPESLVHAGYAAVFSGADGQLMHIQQSGLLFGQMGYAVCGMGDLNGDGRSEVLAAAPYYIPTALADGYVYVYGFDPYLSSDATTISSNTGGTVQFDFNFPSTLGNSFYKLLGTSNGLTTTTIGGLEIPLTANGIVWDTIVANPPPSFLTNATGMLNPDGDGSATLTLPAGIASALIDTNLHFAVIAYAPPTSGLASSAAVALRILP
jgi:hypothetical protein